MSDPFQGMPGEQGSNEKPRDEFGRSLGVANQMEYARFQSLYENLNPGGGRYLSLVLDVLIILGGWAAVTVEVFLRHSFGVRYFSSLRFAFGVFLLSGYTGVMLFLYGMAPDRGIGGVLVLGGYLVLYLLRGAYVRFDGWYREAYILQPWHTKSFGFSHLFGWLEGKHYRRLPPIDESFIYRVVEPCACLFLAWALFVLDILELPTGLLSNWLFIVGFALLFRNNALHMQALEKTRNLVDGRIEAAFLSAKARGAFSRATGWQPPRLPASIDADGNRVPDVLEWSRGQRASMEDILAATLRQNGSGQEVKQ